MTRTWSLWMSLAAALLAASTVACTAYVEEDEVGATREALVDDPAGGFAEDGLLLVDGRLLRGCPEAILREAARSGPLGLEEVPGTQGLVVVFDEEDRPLCVDHIEHVLDVLADEGDEDHEGDAIRWVHVLLENPEILGDPQPIPIQPAEAMGDPQPIPIRPKGDGDGNGSDGSGDDSTLQGYEIEGGDDQQGPEGAGEAAPSLPGTPEPAPGG